ncbi:SDR family oxidoreductase [Cytophagaceae bacterium ABcell3]|nr:SDR family oxidoreductase [Cytophagaceae bacterium ABcell3]
MKYTLITGASRGIGEAIARYCASANMNLILVARSAEALEKVSKEIVDEHQVDIKTFAADLTSPGRVKDLFHWCKAQDYDVNMLVNNAGVACYGKFDDLSYDEQMSVVNLNINTTVNLTYTFLPMLKEQGRAYILNMASTACYQAIPYMSVYAATQAFLQSFSLGIRNELKGENVYVSCVCPGPTATDFFEKSGLAGLPVNSKEVKMSPEEVAETAIQGTLEKVAEIVPGTSNTLGAYFSKLFPNKWVVKMVENYFHPKVSTV